MKSLVLVILFAFGSHTTDSHRILGVFIHPAISHFRTFQPVLEELANRGHEVYVVSYFSSNNSPPNYHDFVLDNTDDILTGTGKVEEVYAPRELFTYYKEFMELMNDGIDSCEKFFTSKHIDTLFDIAREEKFDFLITEYFNTDCVLGFAHALNITSFIGMSSCALMPWHYDRVGLPDTPSYIPNEFVGSSTEMTFFERMTNWLLVHTLKIGYRRSQIFDNERVQARFGKSIPDLRDLAKNTSLILVNQHFSIHGARALTPSVIEIGGIHIEKSKKSLPNDLQQLLDGAKHGVIYVSWGSIITSQGMPLNKKQAIVNAFKRLPQKVLWKWENDSLTMTAKNIHIRSWFPQTDVLCHPNVIAFMSHGGMLGTSEAVMCKKPVIVTPIYGDQFLNAAALESRGMGIIVHYNQLTENNVYNSIQRILQPSYTQKASEVSASFQKRTRDPLETAVFWIEYVAENGAILLQSHATNMNWFIYHSLDVVFVLLCFMGLSFLLISKIVKICFKYSDIKRSENLPSKKKLKKR